MGQNHPRIRQAIDILAFGIGLGVDTGVAVIRGVAVGCDDDTVPIGVGVKVGVGEAVFARVVTWGLPFKRVF